MLYKEFACEVGLKSPIFTTEFIVRNDEVECCVFIIVQWCFNATSAIPVHTRANKEELCSEPAVSYINNEINHT